MKKKKSKNYFDTCTENAIVRYNSESNIAVRNKIYEEEIEYPLMKLAENMLNTFKFPYIRGSFKDRKHDVVCHLLINLNKYSQEKGKAYSYFSVAAKNYLIINNDANFKKMKMTVTIDPHEEEQSDSTVNDIEDYDLIIDMLKKDKSCRFWDLDFM